MPGIRDMTRFHDRVYLEIGREYEVESGVIGFAWVDLVSFNQICQPVY